jgi:prephenate dehydrogenase
MRLAVIGPGLIGRSVTLAARRADPGTHVIEIDRGGALDAARGADLIVLATPVQVILEIISLQSDILRSSVTLDTGSTKRAVLSAARAAGLNHFVGGHPMAGAATAGPADARADLFYGRPFFLVPTGADAIALEFARKFVESLGARPVVMADDGREHDQVMAAVSHLPQVVAAALMAVCAEAAGSRLDWAGAGLRDMTRLAASPASTWQSILDSNADYVAPLLRAMAERLEAVADGLGDGHSVAKLLETANRARAIL